MLGASTKHVADPRSVQSLVDFSRGNLGWLQSEHTESLKRKRSSMSTDYTENGEGSLRGFNQSPSDAYRTPFSALGIDNENHGPITEIPIDPDLDAGETYSMGGHYAHVESFDPNMNNNGNDVNDMGGNGQYTSNDSSSVALVHFPSRSSPARSDSNEIF